MLCGAVVVAASSQSQATTFILGRVVDSQTRAPIAFAVVELITPNVRPPSKATDQQGQFVFRDVKDGSYRLVVNAPGYRRAEYQGGIKRLEVSAKPIGDIEIRLEKLGSIHGRAVGPGGEPMAGVRVTAYDLASPFADPGAPESRTDDRGAYVIGNLIPGRYIVGAHFWTVVTSPSPGARQNSKAIQIGNDTFVPGQDYAIGSSAVARADNGRAIVRRSAFATRATSPGTAEVVTIGVGENHLGADLTIETAVATTVSGRVMATPESGSAFTVRLLFSEAAGPSPVVLSIAETRTDAAGQFRLIGVPAGNYTIGVDAVPPPRAPGAARRGEPAGRAAAPPAPPPPPPPVYFARQPIVVPESGVNDVTVAVRTGLTIRGRLMIDPASANEPNAPKTINFNGPRVGISGGTLNAPVSDAGTFTMTNLSPGGYSFFVDGSRGWHISSIRAGNTRIDGLLQLTGDLSGLTIVISKRK